MLDAHHIRPSIQNRYIIKGIGYLFCVDVDIDYKYSSYCIGLCM